MNLITINLEELAEYLALKEFERLEKDIPHSQLYISELVQDGGMRVAEDINPHFATIFFDQVKIYEEIIKLFRK